MDTDHPVSQAFITLLNELQTFGLKDVNLYIRLAKTKEMIRLLEEQEVELTDLVLGTMELAQEKKKEFEFGKFTVAERAKWKYSPAVDQLAKKLKETKKYEEENGNAVKEITSYLLVK